jgi:hypothetical protein
MKKLVKCKSSKSQTRKRQVLLRTSSIWDTEEEMTAHHSNGNEEVEWL